MKPIQLQITVLFRKTFIPLVLCLVSGYSSAQSFTIDSSFNPFFDIRSGLGGGAIPDIYEDQSGKLYINGSFSFRVNSQQNHGGLTSVETNPTFRTTKTIYFKTF